MNILPTGAYKDPWGSDALADMGRDLMKVCEVCEGGTNAEAMLAKPKNGPNQHLKKS